MDLTSRLRSVIRPNAATPSAGDAPPRRELTYEPDDGRRYEAHVDLDRIADVLGGRLLTTTFGRCLAIERRYEADRWHGDVQIGDCELIDYDSLRILDSAMAPDRDNPAPRASSSISRPPVSAAAPAPSRFSSAVPTSTAARCRSGNSS